MATHSSYLPYSSPCLDAEDIQSVHRVLESGYLSQGAYLAQFEQMFAQSCQAQYAVGFATGTAAMHGMMIAADLGQNAEVIVPALTFAGTSNAILLAGAIPIFGDIHPQTRCLDPRIVASLITPRTKAILTVDFGGHPSDYDALQAIAETHGLQLLSDAAHSNGALYHGRIIGSNLAKMTAFSFNAVKNMTTAEGGMVVTDDEKLYKRLKMVVANGMTRDPDLLEFEAEGAWYYEQHLLSTNYKLNEIQAALGISQLQKLSKFNEKRRELASFYTNTLSTANLPLTFPHVEADCTSAFYLYPILLDEKASISRNTLFQKMQEEKIGVQLHYIPIVLHPYYRKLGYKTDGLPHTMHYYRQALSLPLHPSMTQEDAIRVVAALVKFLS